MIKDRNKELIRYLGLNPLKPDQFQKSNLPLMENLYLWSKQKISLDDIIQGFFNVKIQTKLIAFLLDLDLNNWVGIGASWQENNHTGQLRIDSKLVDFLFSKSFGPSPFNQPFDIKKLNELELTVLQTFLENLETDMKKYWEIDAKHPFLMDIIYLVWVIESEDTEIGRVAYGVPASFKPKILGESFDDIVDLNKLANTGIRVPVDLNVGSTKLPYREVLGLETGDLIVFEDSDSSKLSWHFGEISTVLPETDHSVYLNQDIDLEEIENTMVDKTKNIDNDPLSTLPLELSAEFQKVKIPLKQVLELKSGGVLPLSPILDTELTLTAQGKPVAKGELIIIGNQFGMRIHELLISSKGTIPKTSTPSKPAVKYNTEEESELEEEEELSFDDELQELEEEG